MSLESVDDQPEPHWKHAPHRAAPAMTMLASLADHVGNATTWPHAPWQCRGAAPVAVSLMSMRSHDVGLLLFMLFEVYIACCSMWAGHLAAESLQELAFLANRGLSK